MNSKLFCAIALTLIVMLVPLFSIPVKASDPLSVDFGWVPNGSMTAVTFTASVSGGVPPYQNYIWDVNGFLIGGGATTTWTFPDYTTQFSVTLTVSDSAQNPCGPNGLFCPNTASRSHLVQSLDSSVIVPRPQRGYLWNYGYSTIVLVAPSTFSGTVTMSITPAINNAMIQPIVAYNGGDAYARTVTLTPNQVVTLNVKIWVCGGTPLTTNVYTFTSSDNTDFPTRTLSTTIVAGGNGECAI